MMNTREILQKVANERIRQDTKWGIQNHGPFAWLAILIEEVGEAAKAALEGSSFKYQDELIEVAAVAVAAVESLNRGNTGLDSIVKLQKELKEARARIESLKPVPPCRTTSPNRKA
jgi:NTP pyrophosphatase (non-canonical NTP hydrolase)